MARGSHAPARRHRAIAVVAIVAGVASSAGGAAYSAYRYEQARADRSSRGQHRRGSTSEAWTKVERRAAPRRWTRCSNRSAFERADGAGRSRWKSSVSGRTRWSAVNKALGVGDTMGTFSRFWHRFNDEPIDREIELPSPGTHGSTRAEAHRE